MTKHKLTIRYKFLCGGERNEPNNCNFKTRSSRKWGEHFRKTKHQSRQVAKTVHSKPV